ncbi:MAG: hypothetical protein HY226_04660 [Candidatus Vogelbacteria bacterium]|nr:hypothetical protein [Candidatus Vogelbacteria bacterium]
MIRKMVLFVFVVLSFTPSAFSQESGIIVGNSHGLVFGGDSVILGVLQQKAKKELATDIDRYYTVAIANKETWTDTFTNPESFVICFPKDAGEYGLELQYHVAGKDIYSENRIAGPTVLIKGPPKGVSLILRIIRSPKLK